MSHAKSSGVITPALGTQSRVSSSDMVCVGLTLRSDFRCNGENDLEDPEVCLRKLFSNFRSSDKP